MGMNIQNKVASYVSCPKGSIKSTNHPSTNKAEKIVPKTSIFAKSKKKKKQ